MRRVCRRRRARTKLLSILTHDRRRGLQANARPHRGRRHRRTRRRSAGRRPSAVKVGAVCRHPGTPRPRGALFKIKSRKDSFAGAKRIRAAGPTYNGETLMRCPRGAKAEIFPRPQPLSCSFHRRRRATLCVVRIEDLGRGTPKLEVPSRNSSWPSRLRSLENANSKAPRGKPPLE